MYIVIIIVQGTGRVFLHIVRIATTRHRHNARTAPNSYATFL